MADAGAVDTNGRDANTTKQYNTVSLNDAFVVAGSPSTHIYHRIHNCDPTAISLSAGSAELAVDFTRPGSYIIDGAPATFVSNLQLYQVNTNYIVYHNIRDKEVVYLFT